MPATPVTVVPRVRFPEGPVWCSDGTLVYTSVPDGALYRVDLASGAVTTVAVVGGGANAAAPTADGGFVVTQNGGIDFSHVQGLDLTGLPPYQPVLPGLQHVAADGTVRYLFDDGFLAPNDLTATPDGTEVDRLEVPGPGLVTNCCFGGDDGRTLFVTEGVPGSVVAFEGLPTPGLPVESWALPTVG